MQLGERSKQGKGPDRGGVQAGKGFRQGEVLVGEVSGQGRGPQRGEAQTGIGKGSRQGRFPDRG